MRTNAFFRGAWPLTLLLALGGMLLAGCGASASAATSTLAPIAPGWTWHTDSRYPVRVPIPPGWHVGTGPSGPMDGGPCGYVIGMVPSSSMATPYAAGTDRAPEFIEVSVESGCPDVNISATDQHYKPESRAITISGASATMYDDDSAGNFVQRIATTHFGGHQYLFSFAYAFSRTTPGSQAQEELGVFLQVVHGFRYTGK